MFNRILTPLDGSLPATYALVAAEDLANRFDADLQVLTLTQKGRSEIGLSRIIERQVARIEHHPRVDIRPLSYTVAEDIAGEFDRVDGTLVVMSTWARGRAAGFVSNVSEDVLRLVREPIVMVGPDTLVEDGWLDGPMFITTDGSPFGDSIVPFAGQFAVDAGLEPWLISVVDDSKIPAGVDRAGEVNAVAVLADSMEAVVGKPVNYDVLHGHEPAKAIAEYAERHDASLIAMSTHGRSGVWRLTQGSVAMDVVKHAGCPVLLNRPPAESN
ncbi:MAG: universal stress protein [Acidimicrobiales bacterium]